ncbi:hypothetical protein Vadar_008258 [Vaccinium darrowii]|uniref:Uncharacterized protein n=1 Tax=Vaccinium darrowii TaxID=229202 RepID=A0ACB7Y5W6_9ERIC|nr:hypothetical protein Vadar_008258 [Vaccinium darrowii]
MVVPYVLLVREGDISLPTTTNTTSDMTSPNGSGSTPLAINPETHEIQEIVQILSCTVVVPLVLPFKPALVWASVPMGERHISQPTTTYTESYMTSHYGSGWCHKHGKLLLVYAYMPNGSLDRHLFSDGDNKPLSWNLRYKIISEVASALHYLHNEFDQRVVHRNINLKHIMLDSKFNARLGDLGLSQALHKEKGSYEAYEDNVAGPYGYIAPECFRTGHTDLSDVYSFGIVLLEVGCGWRGNGRPGTEDDEIIFLLEWVWDMYCEGQLLEVVDKRLGEDYVVEEAQRILLLGLACSHPIASERPKTQEIVQILSGSMAVPQVRPFKPPFISPPRPAEEEDIISLSDGVEYNSLTTTSDGSGWTHMATNEETQRPYAYTDFSLI